MPSAIRCRNDAGHFVEANGGKVVGSVRFPFGTPDFSSFVLQAQASKAKVVGLAMSGADLLNAIKQTREFGLVQSGQNLASLVIYINDIEGLGLDVAQGLTLTTSFYWDMNEETRAWAKRFMERSGGFHSQSDHRRHLRLRAALSQGGPGCRDRRREGRRGENARAAGRTISTTRGSKSGRTAAFFTGTYLMKVKSSLGVEVSRRLLQDNQRDDWRRSLQAALGKPMPSSPKKISRLADDSRIFEFAVEHISRGPQRQPSAGATCFRIDSITCAL